MPGQKIAVLLKVPADPRTITQLLEDEGFTVDSVTDLGGGVFASVDIISFAVEHLDDAVIGVLAGVVANWISNAPDSLTKKGVNFSVKKKGGGDTYVIKVKGDGNFVQMHPRPTDEEE